MGQQCCSETSADKNSYNQYEEPAETPKMGSPFKSFDQDLLSIRNFAPIDRVPKLHPKVEEINEKLQPFKPSLSFVSPEGMKEASAYALNNEGLIYNSNGEWRDGVPHGRGQLIYQDGSSYFGYFLKGVPNGQGRFVSSQGWYYEGQLVKEQAQGQGVFVHEVIGYRYEGAWEGDLPNGKGKETWTRNGKVSIYEGEFVGGKKHGKGKYKCGEDWTYEGDFNNNEITSSKGVMKYKNGESFQGHFSDGKKNGFGVYRWPDGSFFEGWYVADRKEGHGKFKSIDNKIFEGEWKNGKREGKGILIIGGKKYPGEWRNDVPKSSKNI